MEKYTKCIFTNDRGQAFVHANFLSDKLNFTGWIDGQDVKIFSNLSDFTEFNGDITDFFWNLFEEHQNEMKAS